MIKINGTEQIGAADRSAVGYEPGKVSKAEMDRAFDKFLDDRGVPRGRQWGRNTARVKPPTPVAVDSPEQPPAPDVPEQLQEVPPSPVPEPAPLPVEEAPVAVPFANPQAELAEATAKLETAFFDYAFCKACCEHPDASPEKITKVAERLFRRLKLPAEILQTGEAR